ncbi:hypothetical protein M427DRAFT_53476 [Gonapodya prolifera JEL478]|uniref:Major facilitator superfamily (MFS) profile domain-containing protein n=1 Tax=Gonapodya prolifera (strain JEL478) TaxID=1344416 RepID=A0A139AQI9_GONPJ|nr:hypothetical protein M427DRAFT_53476 [Gonapodya prolifera JEL478]|eukprot:KXS19020.1 hypothetical protein M427DRAFT_53476 [Gonapodya prolifera JEL478]
MSAVQRARDAEREVRHTRTATPTHPHATPTLAQTAAQWSRRTARVDLAHDALDARIQGQQQGQQQGQNSQTLLAPTLVHSHSNSSDLTLSDTMPSPAHSLLDLIPAPATTQIPPCPADPPLKPDSTTRTPSLHSHANSHSRSRKIFGLNWYPLFLAVASSVGGLLFGYEIGIINQVLLFDSFRVFFGMSPPPVATSTGLTYLRDSQGVLLKTDYAQAIEGNVVALFLLGAVAGACGVWVFADNLGRRASLLVGTTLHIIGGLIQISSGSIEMLYVGRLCTGVGIGLISGTVPLYLAECAPPSFRGRMVSSDQLMITLGILASNIVNAALTAIFPEEGNEENNMVWRWALGLQLAPAMLLLVFIASNTLPESPRYLIAKGYYTQALVVLSRIADMPAESAEMQEMYCKLLESITSTVQGSGPYGTLSYFEARRWDWWTLASDPSLRRRASLAFWIFAFQQFTGVNAIMYFSSSLFLELGLNKTVAAQIATTGKSLVNFLLTFLGMAVIDNPKVGRRGLLLWGAAAAGVSMVSTFMWVQLFQNTEPGSARSAYSAMGIVSMYAFVAVFAATLGPATWVTSTEIFPIRFRGKGMTVATVSHWGWNAVIAKVWPYTSAAIGAKQFLVFGVACFMECVWVYYAVPETALKRLEDIDEVFGAAHDSTAVETRAITRGASDVLLSFYRASEPPRGLQPEGSSGERRLSLATRRGTLSTLDTRRGTVTTMDGGAPPYRPRNIS